MHVFVDKFVPLCSKYDAILLQICIRIRIRSLRARSDSGKIYISVEKIRGIQEKWDGQKMEMEISELKSRDLSSLERSVQTLKEPEDDTKDV